jgi:hypothetical protein
VTETIVKLLSREYDRPVRDVIEDRSAPLLFGVVSGLAWPALLRRLEARGVNFFAFGRSPDPDGDRWLLCERCPLCQDDGCDGCPIKAGVRIGAVSSALAAARIWFDLLVLSVGTRLVVSNDDGRTAIEVIASRFSLQHCASDDWAELVIDRADADGGWRGGDDDELQTA